MRPIAHRRLREASATPLPVILFSLRISFARYDCPKYALCRPLAAADSPPCEVSEAEAVRLTDLIEDLLTLSRADDPQHAPLTTAVAIRPILEEVAAIFSQQAGSRVRFETPASTCFVRGDVSSLRRLLVILVENALRHNPDDTSVLISARKEGGCLRVSVTDTGQGIPAHELPKVFDRFYRGDPSRRQANGHGLGLSIAKWIAQCHGTEITGASIIGEGSTFSFSLALCDAP